MFAVHSTKVCISSQAVSPRVINCRHRVGTEEKKLLRLETWKTDRQLPSFHVRARRSGAAEGLRGVLLTGRAEQANPIKAFSGPNSRCSDFPGEQVKNHGEDILRWRILTNASVYARFACVRIKQLSRLKGRQQKSYKGSVQVDPGEPLCCKLRLRLKHRNIICRSSQQLTESRASEKFLKNKKKVSYTEIYIQS